MKTGNHFAVKTYLAIVGFIVVLAALFLNMHRGNAVTDNKLEGTRVDIISTEKVYQKDDIIISLVPKALDNPVFLDAKEGSEYAGKECGIRTEWMGSFQVDSREQELVIESLIRRNVDGIAVSCIDPVRIRSSIDRAVACGIKVATFDSDSPDSNRLFYCGTDNYKAGTACGEAFLRTIERKKIEKDVLKVLVMTGDTGSLNLNERLRGFRDTISKAPLNLVYVDTLSCNDDINKAGELVEQYIRSNNSIDVFFSTGGWPLIVPPDSMPDFQKWCRAGGISIVVDTSYPIIVSARKGMADALVGQDFKRMGELAVRNLYKAVKGEEIDTQFFDTGLELADENNFETLLKIKKPWEMK